MKFTVVMPSYLGPYKNAASNREQKIHRAIRSVIDQSFQDWELFIVADGCEETFAIVHDNYFTEDRIKCSLINKQAVMSGNPRNLGIKKAEGVWIVYLDIDDYFGKYHLEKIAGQLGGQPWVYFNDWKWNIKKKEFVERQVNIHKRYFHGTSNLCHRTELNVLWKNSTYEHDYHFVLDLKKNSGYSKIDTPFYCVCHLPGEFDV